MSPTELGQLLFACTHDVFSTVLHMEITAADLGRDGSPPVRAEATALIGLAGELQGSLSLHCTQEQAREFAMRMLGPDAKVEDEQAPVLDAIGEIANMIAGNLKRTMPGPRTFDLSLPIAAFLRQFHIRTRGGSSVIISCTSPLGPFCVELILA